MAVSGWLLRSIAACGVIATVNFVQSFHMLKRQLSTRRRGLYADVLDETQRTRVRKAAAQNSSLSSAEVAKHIPAPSQRNDGTSFDTEVEKQRCARYGYEYNGRKSRRRLFYGSLLADDSDLLLQVHAAEAYNVYHAMAFVEYNATQKKVRRTLKFPKDSDRYKKLINGTLFGPQTHVVLDHLATTGREYAELELEYQRFMLQGHSIETLGNQHLHQEQLMRQPILRRWKELGMQPEDIGVFGDADEFFTRDFLRAAQICDIPQFRANQDCRAPKILGKGLIFEASPQCVVQNLLLWHPDMILGECLEYIGDEHVHTPPLRLFTKRAEGYGRRDERDYGLYSVSVANRTLESLPTGGRIMYPLWSAGDLRSTSGGVQPNSTIPTAIHLHNFFESLQDIRFKYNTYGEPVPSALTKPLSLIHEELSFASDCIHGRQSLGVRKRLMGGYKDIVGPRPILFEQDAQLRETRHKQVKSMILQDEREHGMAIAECNNLNCIDRTLLNR